MNDALSVYNDPDVIQAKFQNPLQSNVLVTQGIGGAITSIGGALGPAITLASSNGALASGAGNTLTFSLTQNLAVGGSPTFAGLTVAGTPFRKSNYAAIVAPTVNEDSGDGYAVGSLWVDTVLDDAYICCDATVAAAVWKKITP